MRFMNSWTFWILSLSPQCFEVRQKSVFFDHVQKQHEGRNQPITLEIEARFPGNAALRQAAEAVAIRENKPILNGKEENTNQPRRRRETTRSDVNAQRNTAIWRQKEVEGRQCMSIKARACSRELSLEQKPVNTIIKDYWIIKGKKSVSWLVSSAPAQSVSNGSPHIQFTPIHAECNHHNHFQNF